MKRKNVFKFKTVVLAAVFSAALIVCGFMYFIGKASAMSPASVPSPSGNEYADSIFNSMSLEEKIMQLYVFDARRRAPDFFKNPPSGVFFNAENFSDLKKVIAQTNKKLGVPFISICEITSPMNDLPNYMNPLALKASGSDSILKQIFSRTLADTLKSIGISFVKGTYGRNINKYLDYDSGKKFIEIQKANEIEGAILSDDNDMILSELNPDLFLSEVKKMLAKDRKHILADKIDEKVIRILREKCCKEKTYENFWEGSGLNKEDLEFSVASKSITCIKNDSKFLPLKDLSKTVIIQIGGIQQLGFISRSYSYGDFKYYYCTPKTSAIKQTLKNAKGKNVIFIVNTMLKDSLASLIRPILREKHSCIVNIDNPENLELCQAKSALQVFGNGFQSGDAASQAVFGGLKVKGRFPLEGYQSVKKDACTTINPIRLQYCLLKETGFKSNYRDTLDSIVRTAIADKCFPGCQIFASIDGKVVINQGFGHHTYDSDSKPVSTTDLYDLASLTKVSATTVMAMYLTGKKLLDPKAKLGTYFNSPIDWSNLSADTVVNGKDTVLIRDIPTTTVYDVPVKSILEHRSGINPYAPIFRFVYTYQSLRRCVEKLNINPDTLKGDDLKRITFNEYYSDRYIKDTAETRVWENTWLKNNYRDSLYNFIMRLNVSEKKTYKYSDVNMILLQMASENILKCKSDEFMKKTFYLPLGMRNTCYTPYRYFDTTRIVPTEKNPWTGKMICGDVHDPSAALLGGISGNAGLFSTASDLGVLFQMLLNYGEYGGQRYLDSLTVRKFTQKQPGTSRALGFDMTPSKYAAESASRSTYGHTGFTGTCAWTDPENKIVIVFLSNRVYPEAGNQNINKYAVRKKICQTIYNGLGITNETKKM